MNVAVIFAGGAGVRMNAKTLPKQFLELHGKPIIIYTLEHFDRHPQIDGIVIACIAGWEKHLETLTERFGIRKISAVVKGGTSGQASIRNAVYKARELFPEDSVVLVHDGVRPLIDEQLITENIESVRRYGSAISSARGAETVLLQRKEDDYVERIEDRSVCKMAKAPQSFILGELCRAHEKAEAEGIDDFIDSASLMLHYGMKLRLVGCSSGNIKITTPTDFYLFRAIMDAMENEQIVGYQEKWR